MKYQTRKLGLTCKHVTLLAADVRASAFRGNTKNKNTLWLISCPRDEIWQDISKGNNTATEDSAVITKVTASCLNERVTLTLHKAVKSSPAQSLRRNHPFNVYKVRALTARTLGLRQSDAAIISSLLKKNVKYWKIIASKMWPLPEKWTFSYQKYCLKFRPKSSITTRRCSELSAEIQKRWRGRVPPTAEETFSGFSRCQWETTGLILLWGYTRRPLRNWLHHQQLGFQASVGGFKLRHMVFLKNAF